MTVKNETKLNMRQKQAMETRKRLYNCAHRLFHDKGYNDVKMLEIAKAAGVSVGTCYHHFNSKQEFFQEVFRISDNYFLNEVPKLLKKGSACDKIVEFFSKYYGGTTQDDGVKLCINIYLPTNKLFIQQNRGMHLALKNIIAQGQADGELSVEKNAEELTEYLFIIARGVVFHWCLKDGDFDLEKALEDHIKRALTSFCAK